VIAALKQVKKLRQRPQFFNANPERGAVGRWKPLDDAEDRGDARSVYASAATSSHRRFKNSAVNATPPVAAGLLSSWYPALPTPAPRQAPGTHVLPSGRAIDQSPAVRPWGFPGAAFCEAAAGWVLGQA